METSAFDYELPESAIAQHPLAERDAARLLVDQGTGSKPLNHIVRELPDLLEPGDLLVLNTTRVLPARLALRKETGAAVEVLLLERLDGGSLSDSGQSRWEALVRPGRKLPSGTIVRPESGSGLEVSVDEDLGDGRRVVTINVEGPLLDVLEQHGCGLVLDTIFSGLEFNKRLTQINLSRFRRPDQSGPTGIKMILMGGLSKFEL